MVTYECSFCDAEERERQFRTNDELLSIVYSGGKVQIVGDLKGSGIHVCWKCLAQLVEASKGYLVPKGAES